MIVPDGIEPIEALRAWVWHGREDRLASLTSGAPGGVLTMWCPGRALEAVCHAPSRTGFQPTAFRWTVVNGGMNYEQACAHVKHSALPRPPKTVLPDGLGYALVERDLSHSAPHERCRCGIYAASKWASVPWPSVPWGPIPWGPVEGCFPVLGTVKLWGKVIPGLEGFRAQFAYPAALYVPAEFVEHPGVLAYGVPVTDIQATGVLDKVYQPDRPRPKPKLVVSSPYLPSWAYKQQTYKQQTSVSNGSSVVLRWVGLAALGFAVLACAAPILWELGLW